MRFAPWTRATNAVRVALASRRVGAAGAAATPDDVGVHLAVILTDAGITGPEAAALCRRLMPLANTLPGGCPQAVTR